jgi:hypothetical protein
VLCLLSVAVGNRAVCAEQANPLFPIGHSL